MIADTRYAQGKAVVTVEYKARCLFCGGNLEIITGAEFVCRPWTNFLVIRGEDFLKDFEYRLLVLLHVCPDSIKGAGI